MRPEIMQVITPKISLNNNKRKIFFEQLKKSEHANFLQENAIALLNDFGSDEDLTLDIKKIFVDEINVELRSQLLPMLNLAYLYRYSDPKNNNEPIMSAIEKGDYAKTIVATMRKDGKDILLGTVQLVQGNSSDIYNLEDSNLEFVKFFTLKNENEQWPHQVVNKIPAELGRFAFHPIFDLARCDANSFEKEKIFKFKQQLTYLLWRQALTYLQPLENYVVIGVMVPAVHDFVTKLGIKATECTQVVLKDSVAMQYLKKHLGHYFSQAKLYVLEERKE